MQRQTAFCSVAITFLLAMQFYLGVAEAQSAAQEMLRGQLERDATNGKLEIEGEVLHTALLKDVYSAADYQLLWLRDSQLDALGLVAQRLEREGLDPTELPLEALRKAREAARLRGGDNDRINVDLLATEALLRASYQLYFGKVNPAALDSDWNYSRKLPAAGALRKAIASPDLAAYLDTTIPRGAIYTATMDGLAQYRAFAAASGWPLVSEGPTLREGDSGSRVAELRLRLQASGQLAVPSANDSAPASGSAAGATLQDIFGPELKAGVERFQAQHGLVVDGIVGKGTIAALNVPVATRVDQLRMGLERMRWVQQDMQDDMLLVNIAGFKQFFVRNGKLVFQSRIMVGQPFRKTPTFRSDIRYLVLNPTWTVPPTILAEDVLPAMRKNPAYLRERNLTVLTPDGQTVNPASINWQRATPKRFPYILRQQPGPQNAMGQVKFMFPNEHLIYLHDTPSRALFGQAERTFSSGCIRVERPLELAELLLDGQPGWNRAKIDEVLASRVTRNVNLERPMPILIMYLTALAEPDGQTHFYRDVYKRDPALLKALNEPLVMDVPTRDNGTGPND